MIGLQIRMEDLPESQKEIAELIGLENYVKMSKRFGGINNFYIHKYSEIVREARNREIRKKYNGYNAKALASQYNLSEQAIYAIIRCDSDDQLRFL